jgi:glycosyltransferase involved in cell wall biosynthesis
VAEPKPLKVVFCWAEVSGYIAACWRELQRFPGVQCHILHPKSIYQTIENPFDMSPLLSGLSNDMFDPRRPDAETWLADTIARHNPDVVVVCGWVIWPYVSLFSAEQLAGVKFVVGMDTPWQGTLRQRLGRWRLRRLVQNTTLWVTASERSAEYARRLGVPDALIRKGFYGFDDAPLAGIATERQAAPWARRFLFVGRYVPQKDLRTLVTAYRRYRSMVREPWSLTCCGTGVDAHFLRGVEGLTDAGFKQPAELPGVFAEHGAFVIASSFEPWGVVIAEAAASGLPIVCTSSCGAADDVVRPYYNGLLTSPGDADSLARALCWIHEHETSLAAMGDRARALAAPFAASEWARRWQYYLLDAVAAR